eukprot:PhM_4_TR8480/c0_g1_i2/m.73859/K03010/RPB2, POLR2B; DNA-directed RNA polymerase II subunit RPB2
MSDFDQLNIALDADDDGDLPDIFGGQTTGDAGDELLTQEEVWEVVTAFFEEKGLVSQQLDSFNHFMLVGTRRIAHEMRPIELEQQNQSRPGEDPTSFERESVTLELRDVFHSMPQEASALPLGGDMERLIYPHDCRLRRLTYDAALQCNVRMRRYTEHRGVQTLAEDKEYQRVDIGRIPVMLKSKWCNLSNLREPEMPYVSECLHDQGGYFVIKGTEKVMIAQERQAMNHVMVFSRKADIVLHSSEVRSSIEGSYRAPSTLAVRM